MVSLIAIEAQLQHIFEASAKFRVMTGLHRRGSIDGTHQLDPPR
jgi:hypothetical protein